MNLPATPITDAPAPEWTGYGYADGGVVALPPGVTAVPLLRLITRDQLAAHLQRPDAWRSLPDGRPLRLCADAIEYLVDDFGGFVPGSLRSAHRVLYFATRTPAQMDAFWCPPPLPEAESGTEREAGPREGLAFHLRELQMEISRWARETFAPCAHQGVKRLAFALWFNLVDRLPVPAEKKSPEPTTPAPECGSPTSGKSAGSSAEDAPCATSNSDAPTCSSSPTPSYAGPPSTDTPSSPPPKSSDSSLPPGD